MAYYNDYAMTISVSVIIPVYNGAANVAALVESVQRELADFQLDIILVDDGSRDNSEAVCEELARSHGIKFLSLRRNFGEHNAVLCGLNYAEGDYSVIIDDDFQNPPFEIRALLEEASKGYDVVFSRYHVKQHHWFRNFGSRLNDLIATWLLGKPRNLYLSSFKVIRSEVVREIIKYKGPFPYIDGLILRVTHNFSSVVVSHDHRAEGRSNYTFGKLVSLYLNMFLNFSIKPLRLFTITGTIMFCIGILLSGYFIVAKLLNPAEQLGWTSLIVSVLTLSGVQLMFLGLIGEYLGKAYLDLNGTPQWVVKRKLPAGIKIRDESLTLQ